jgi:hypothetical protein
MGYIEVPSEDIDFFNHFIGGDGKEGYSRYSEGNMRLIPIGFSIEINGNILLQFQETARVEWEGAVSTDGTRMALFTSPSVSEEAESGEDAAAGGEAPDATDAATAGTAGTATETAAARTPTPTDSTTGPAASRTPRGAGLPVASREAGVARPGAPPADWTVLPDGAVATVPPAPVGGAGSAAPADMTQPIPGVNYFVTYNNLTDGSDLTTLSGDYQKEAVARINSGIIGGVLNRDGTVKTEEMAKPGYAARYTRLTQDLQVIDKKDPRWVRRLRAWWVN